jgi:hypothetical protein
MSLRGRGRQITRDEVNAILAEMAGGVGLWRAAAEAEVPESVVKRAMRVGKALEDEDPRALECEFLRRVNKQRAKTVAKAERVIDAGLESKDEDRALATAKFILPRLAGREYSEKTMALQAEQRVAESLLEAMREEISASAYAEVVAFLAGRGLTEDE